VSRRDGTFVALAAASIALVLGVPALGRFWTFVATLAVIYTMLGISLVVLTGWSGQLNLHVAALGLGWGAYASYALARAGLPEMLAILLAPALTVPFSLFVGAVAVRFRGLELAVATLAIGLVFERLAFRNIAKALAAHTGGTPFESSLVRMNRPAIGGLHFTGDTSFYLLSLALGAAVLVVVRTIGASAIGRNLHAIRERELTAEVVGVPAIRYRIGAFVGSIAIAALAGGLFASYKFGIAPDSFNLDLSFPMLAAVVIFGIRTVWGGVLGGAFVAVFPEIVRTGALSFLAEERQYLVFGLGLVAVLLFRPEGLLRRSGPNRPVVGGDFVPPKPPLLPRLAESNAQPHPRRATLPATLRAQDLSVRFGGVRALDGVSLSLPPGEICALIGPNGAGKSTLFNCLTGVVRPDTGSVYLAGTDVTHMPPSRRAQLGLGRTFQSIELFPSFTLRENLMVAGHLSRAGERELERRAFAEIERLGLGDVAHATPAELSFGHLRLAEIGLALMADPAVLLLDEPTAGLNPADSTELARFIVGLRDERGLSVMLVEHDMSVVGEIAEWVYVLDFGSLIASGPPERIRRDPVVIARYLGTPEAVHA
jgi:sulfate-transporting ATPase